MTKISIIIATYNSADVIIRNLRSLLAQDLSDEAYEIIIIDDASKDETRATLERFIKNKENIRFYPLDKNHGNGFCKNLGIKKAQGEYLFFVDDHLFFNDEKAIHKMFSFLVDHADILGVCGKYGSSDEKDYNICRDIRRFAIYGKDDSDLILNPDKFIPFSIVISAFNRDRLEGLEFPENFKQCAAEDVMMQLHAHQQGERYAYLADIDVSHDHNLSLRDLVTKSSRELGGFTHLLREMCTNSYFRSLYLPTFLSFPLLLWIALVTSFFIPKAAFVALSLFGLEVSLLLPILSSRFSRSARLKTLAFCLGMGMVKPFYIIKLLCFKPTKIWAVFSLLIKWECKKLMYYYEHRLKKPRPRKTSPLEPRGALYRHRSS